MWEGGRGGHITHHNKCTVYVVMIGSVSYVGMNVRV